MIDKMFAGVLVLNMTGLLLFVSASLNVSIRLASAVLLVANVVYLVLRGSHTRRLVMKREVLVWLCVLLLWPLVSLLYAPSIEWREVGLLVGHVLLLAGAAVYVLVSGPAAMRRVLGVGLVVTVVGTVWSLTAPEHFERVGEMAGATLSYEGRAFGFLLQPNSLAISLVFLTIGWTSLGRQRRSWFDIVVILVLLATLLSTGSRTGVLAGVLVVAFLVANWLRRQQLGAGVLLRLGLLIASLSAVVFGLRACVPNVGDSHSLQAKGIVDRVESLVRFRFTSQGRIMDDTSVQERLVAQSVYVALIAAHPLRGHGLGAEARYRETGAIAVPSHSAALTLMMQYGIAYFLVICLLAIRLWYKSRRIFPRGAIETRIVGQFVLLLLLLLPINGAILYEPAFYVSLGVFIILACISGAHHRMRAVHPANRGL